MTTALFRSNHQRWLLLGLLLAGCLLLATLSGGVKLSLQGLMHDELERQVFFSIRLPRLLLALVVGATLAISGAAMQGLFRNPMADPSLIGIAGGAALAVGIAIVLVGPRTSWLGLYGNSIAAFSGAIAASTLLLALARRSQAGVLGLLLAGIAINALAMAGTSLMSYLANDQQLRSLSLWQMGNLGHALWPQVAVCASVALPAVWLIGRSARQLDLLQLGEAEARSLGVDATRLERRILVACALAVGACVAMAGMIGFIGLMVPHLMRLALGAAHRALLPASALAGASLLLAADSLARTLVMPAELPVGILTSLLGAPYFLWLLSRLGRNH